MDNLVPLSLIDDNPFQTRQGYDEPGIAELAADIYARGLLQPPVGRRVDGRVQLAFGHRRLRAYRHICTTIDSMGWQAMPVIERELSDEQMALFAWSENAQRKELTAVEEAQAIQRMVEAFGWSASEIATKLGVDRSTVANKLRLLKLPEEVQDRVVARTLSERQAMALAPLYDLPAPVLKAYEAQAYAYPRLKDMVDRAGTFSSDSIRRDVQHIIQNATKELARPWVEMPLEDRYCKAPLCGACSLRVRVDGELRCPVNDCWERKEQAYRGHRQTLAMIQSGIAIHDGDLEYSEFEWLNQVPHPERILERHCPNLRLRYNDNRGMSRLLVDGFDDVEIICLHGKDNKCTCTTQAKAAATREANQEPDAQALAAARRRIQDEIVAPMDAAVLAGFEAGDLGVWQELLERVSNASNVRAADLDDARRKIARALGSNSYNMAGWLRGTDYGCIKEHAEQQLKRMSIEPPWRVSALEIVRRKWIRIEGWLTSRRWLDTGLMDEFSLAAVRGNLDNLVALVEEYAGLTEESDVALLAEIAQAQRLLQGILPVLEELAGATKGTFPTNRHALQENCRQLTDAEPGSVDFDQALREAIPATLRYALAAGDGFDRVVALRDRLVELETAPEMVSL